MYYDSIMERELGLGGESRTGGAGLHVVALPYPLQGHIAPMLQLCNLLATRDISVSFIHQDSNLASLHFSQPQHTSPSIRHVSLPLSLPGKPSSSASSTRLRVLASEQLLPSFSLLLSRLHASTKVSCVIADVLMSWALPVAAELDIPGASLWTAGLSSLTAYCNIPLLALEGVFPINAMEGGAQQLIRCIPGLPQIFQFADLPSFFHAPSWPDDVLDFITRQVQHMKKSTWVLSNHAFVEPEVELDQEMSTRLPLLSIGPLLTLQHHHFPNGQIQGPHRKHTKHTRASLWHEDLTCLEWLHGRPLHSVLYISFGSVVAPSTLQIEEILLGLETSKQPFLWALRPDAVEGVGDTSSETLTAFVESHLVSRKTNMGLIVPWAPQLDVLAHDSIGGFLTHCGWNSVMESIAMGKPMLGLPRFVEQKMNCRLLEHWQVGKELLVGIDGLVNRREVESGVKSLMKEGNSFRNACTTLKALVLEAISDGNGSSSKNLDRFVADLRERVGKS